MRGWRSGRAKAKAAQAAPAATPAPEPTLDLRADAAVDALVVMADDPPAQAWVGRDGPPQPAAPEPPVSARPPSGQAEILRLLEVVTNMCDHVIEYIEADKADRRLMLETLTQLGRVITDGAATIAAVSAQALAAPAAPVTIEVADVPTDPAPTPAGAFAVAPGERVLGGSMPAGPEPVIDLVEPEPEPDPEPSPEPQPEFATVAPPSAAATMEIAVEVRGRFGDRWVDGFEICEVMTTPDGPRYRLRRQRDGVVLPELFDATNIRHVETFEQLGDAFSAHPAGKGRINGNGNGNGSANGSAGYWSRS